MAYEDNSSVKEMYIGLENIKGGANTRDTDRFISAKQRYLP